MIKILIILLVVTQSFLAVPFPEAFPKTRFWNVSIGEDLTITCKYARKGNLCPSQQSGDNQLKWKNDKQLTPYTRVHPGGSHCHYDEDLNRSTFFSHLFISSAGYLHEAAFNCRFQTSSGQIEDVSNYHVQVKENDGQCEFHDQCRSLQCFDKKCRCDGADQNYIESKDICTTRKNYSQTCERDDDCRSKPMHLFEYRNTEEMSCEEQLTGPSKCLCPDSYSYHNRTGRCLLHVKELGHKCIKKSNCKVKDSYCMNKGSEESTCECKDGYKNIQNRSCEVIRLCHSKVSSEENVFDEGDCGENQYCRKETDEEGICLCKPNYVFDEHGNCSNHQDEIPPTSSRNQLVTTTSIPTISSENEVDATTMIPKRTQQDYTVFWVVISLVFAVIIIVVIGVVCKKCVQKQSSSQEGMGIRPLPQKNEHDSRPETPKLPDNEESTSFLDSSSTR